MGADSIRAHYYDGRSAGARGVMLALEWAGESPGLSIQDQHGALRIPFSALVVDERVGDTHRLLHLPGGASLEVLDNEGFDHALEAAGVRTPERPLRRLEAQWRYAVLAIVVIGAGSWSLLRFGTPLLAARAVALMPPSVDAMIGADSLRVLDRSLFSATKLSTARQDELRRLFVSMTDSSVPEGMHFRLEFRRGGSIGANALALPSGIVVLTDELEQLARSDDEIAGVLAHEMGHLVRRHAMRMLVQSSASALLITGMLGDVSALSSLISAAPTVLVNAAYSRDFEREADSFAYRWMTQHDVPPQRLADLLTRLAATKSGDGGGFLASHPDIRERIAALKTPTPDPDTRAQR